MQTKLLKQGKSGRTFAVVLETGEEAVSCLRDFARNNQLRAAQITAIGALSKGTLAYFDWESKSYQPIAIGEQVEVAALTGDIASGEDGQASLHMHVVLGRRDGSALAGHLVEAYVRPTLEVIITETPAYLHKRRDPESGLALIAIGGKRKEAAHSQG